MLIHIITTFEASPANQLPALCVIGEPSKKEDGGHPPKAKTPVQSMASRRRTNHWHNTHSEEPACINPSYSNQ